MHVGLYFLYRMKNKEKQKTYGLKEVRNEGFGALV